VIGEVVIGCVENGAAILEFAWDAVMGKV
jgi:hypothetical protein